MFNDARRLEAAHMKPFARWLAAILLSVPTTTVYAADAAETAQTAEVADPSPHPRIPHDSTWAAEMVGVILTLFALAILAGLVIAPVEDVPEPAPQTDDARGRHDHGRVAGHH
jgi:hypothetical protein